MRAIDITGRTFGLLTAFRRADPPSDAGGNARWVCQCECGRWTVAAQNNLRSGHTTSCNVGHQAAEMTGRKFGLLTVLRQVARTAEQAKWKCRCACGRETEVNGDALRSGKTKSCGQKCLLKRIRRLVASDASAEKRLEMIVKLIAEYQ